MNGTLLRTLAFAALLGCGTAQAVVGVSPAEVHVRSSGQTTAFLSYQGLDANEAPVDSYFCAAVRSGILGGSVVGSNPCTPGTLFGRLPCRLDRSCISRSGAAPHLVDLMTVPAAVARRAYQDAARGGDGVYYYVRRFTGGVAGDRYAVVALRISSGGTGTPLALLDVRLGFAGHPAGLPVLDVERDTPLPAFGAHIFYNGTGRLTGRWELVQPGDPAPSELDLRPEGSLPAERRGEQRRYLLLERFSVFLMPNGRGFIPGPQPSHLPRLAGGPHLLLLRIEASGGPDNRSDTGGGLLLDTGGVAAFALPVLRVHVHNAPLRTAPADAPIRRIDLLAPRADAPLEFQWTDVAGAHLYRLELRSEDAVVFRAYARPGEGHYQPPPWLRSRPAGPLRWRVVALDPRGLLVGSSTWRDIEFQAP